MRLLNGDGGPAVLGWAWTSRAATWKMRTEGLQLPLVCSRGPLVITGQLGPVAAPPHWRAHPDGVAERAPHAQQARAFHAAMPWGVDCTAGRETA